MRQLNSRQWMDSAVVFGALLAIIWMPDAALASAIPPTAPATVGEAITTTTGSMSTLPLLISMFGYFMGLMYAVIAIFKLKEHVDQPAQVPISVSMKRFFAGGMALSLAFMANSIYGSIFGEGGELLSFSKALPASSGASAGAIDGMIVDFILDIQKPMEILLTLFTYLAGGIFLLLGIQRLTKRMDEGPRGPAGLGTIMTFLVSGVLFGVGDMMSAFTTSIFGDNDIAIEAQINNDILKLDPNDLDRVENVILALMYFVALVGFIAFVRGLFVLRSFADGQQGATLAQGLTFLFGGAVAINLGEFVNMLQKTINVSGISFQ
jgi:hypothetical protein